MERDASVKTQDMRVLDEMDMAVFDQESLRSYRQRMRLARPGHVWEMLDDGDFLLKIGAAGIGPDGQEHPTSAGLLMFGNEYDIVREFNSYLLCAKLSAIELQLLSWFFDGLNIHHSTTDGALFKFLTSPAERVAIPFATAKVA